MSKNLLTLNELLKLAENFEDWGRVGDQRRIQPFQRCDPGFVGFSRLSGDPYFGIYIRERKTPLIPIRFYDLAGFIQHGGYDYRGNKLTLLAAYAFRRNRGLRKLYEKVQGREGLKEEEKMAKILEELKRCYPKELGIESRQEDK